MISPINSVKSGEGTNCSLVNLNVLAYEYPPSSCPLLLCVGIAGSLSALEILPSPPSSSSCVNAFNVGRMGAVCDGFVAGRAGVLGAEGGVWDCWAYCFACSEA